MGKRTNRFGRCLAAGVWGLSLALVAPSSRGLAEESVLVATREAKPSQSTDPAPSDGAGLEPISQYSEHAPELAEPVGIEADASEFARALSEATDAEPPRRFRAADDLSEAGGPGLAAEPAQFHGIQPGASTRDEVLAAWGEPAHTESKGGGGILRYEIAPFRQVEVLIKADRVAAIKIELDGCLPPKRLARQLSLDTVGAVVVEDEQGQALGQAYPEKGVLFLFAPPAEVVPATTVTSPSAVTHVVIQPLDANAFALRAESRLHGPYEQNIRDLETALTLNPDLAHAHWLLAEIHLATGQADRALEAAEAACELEPDHPAYKLRRAQALKAVGRYDEATYAVRAVLDDQDAPTIVKAQALHEMALLAALGEAPIAAKAIGFDTKAIELADALATSKNVQERRAAIELLVEAHLSTARQIASHAFNNKLESVSLWIGRASGLAESMIAKDGGSLELRLLVAKEALGALASFKPTKDPEPFLAEAKQATEALLQQYDDELWQRRLQWELGQAYYYAVRIEHMRAEPVAALRYGQLAIENLAEGAATRQAIYEAEQLVGELYFQIGAVHAIHKQDHETAAQWYDKAMPLLTAPRPASELLAPQRDGEELVSMGLTYWQIGEKDHALELTLDGTKLVEQAVERGVLPKSSLGVPYGNLATMYQQLGETADANKYAQLAKSVGAGSPEAPPVKRSARQSRPRTSSGPRPTPQTRTSVASRPQVSAGPRPLY